MGTWLINTSGIGSLIVFGVGFSVLGAYIFMLRWIKNAPPEPAQEGESETEPKQ